jgi:hypothetical protein
MFAELFYSNVHKKIAVPVGTRSENVRTNKRGYIKKERKKLLLTVTSLIPSCAAALIYASSFPDIHRHPKHHPFC